MISGSWIPGAKSVALTVNGSAVADELVSIVYTDDLVGGGSALTIGAASAARVRIIVDSPSVSYEDAVVTLSVGGIPLGTFYVTDHSEKDGRLTVDAVDVLGTEAAQGEYTPSASSGTALGVAREICAALRLTLADVSGITDVPVSGLTAGHTYRDMLGFMAAVLGRNAHIDRYGRLTFRWYAAPSVGSAQAVDIGSGNIDLRGVLAEETDTGRVQITYGVTAVESGEGHIVLTASGVYLITVDDTYAGELSKKTRNAVLTGIRCSVTTTTTATDTDDDGNTTTTEEQTTTTLSAGGAAAISMRCDYMTASALGGIYSRIGGFTYRPMTLSFYGDCRLETGDLIRVEDREGNAYNVPVASVTHSWDGGVRTTVTANASAASYTGSIGAALSRVTEDLSGFKNQEAANVRAINSKIAAEITSREQAIQSLTTALANASGLYQTTETPAGGGTVYYLHDKSTMAASSLVIKLTADALGVSTDGGRTYSAGHDFATGTTITNILQAVGINADWIETGALTVYDSGGNILFQADKDTNFVFLGGFAATQFGLGKLIDPMNYIIFNLDDDGFFIGVDPVAAYDHEYAQINTNGDAAFHDLTVHGRNVLSELDTKGPTLLWTNPDPTVAFGAQIININNLSDYTLIYIEGAYDTSVSWTGGVWATVGNNQLAVLSINRPPIGGGNPISTAVRGCMVDANEVYFLEAYYQASGGTSSASDNYAIPLRIYGIK